MDLGGLQCKEFTTLEGWCVGVLSLQLRSLSRPGLRVNRNGASTPGSNGRVAELPRSARVRDRESF